MKPMAAPFEEYSGRYENIRLERRDGILQATVHTEGDSLVWSSQSHDELAYCFGDIACDRGNKVVILTGAGTSFCDTIDFSTFNLGTPHHWDEIMFEGQRLLNNLLSIEVPIVAAVNGPVTNHPEIPVMADIVIASEGATFQDGPHFPSGIVPGDGAHVVWPHVLGSNRGRYFLLTGQLLDARTALDYGAVNEVVSKGQLLPRAWEIARVIAQKPELTRRYARKVLTRQLRRVIEADLGFGLAHEALAAIDLATEGN